MATGGGGSGLSTFGGSGAGTYVATGGGKKGFSSIGGGFGA
jgi:hypothetical protein